MRLGWTAPADDGGDPDITYVVMRGSATSPRTWTVAGTTTGTSIDITGLSLGSRHWFQVAARNSAGTGQHLAFGWVGILGPRPPTPKIPTGRNGMVYVGWYTTGVPNLPDQGPPVAVRIERSTPGRTGFTWAGTTTVSAGTFVVKGLTNGKRYWFRIGYVFRNGDFAWSESVTAVPRTVPTAPRAPFIIGGHDVVGIEWARPAFDGGAPVDGYRIQFSFNGTSWTDWAQSGTQWNGLPWPYERTWAILEPDSYPLRAWIMPGRRLWVRVAAMNEAGVGPFTVLGSTVPYTYPGFPTNVRATPASGGVALSWTPPTTTGFRPLAPYEIQVRRSGTSTWTTVGRTSATSFRVTGLANGARYCVRVVAWNTGGSGSSSVRVGFTAGSWASYDPQGWTCG